MAIIKVPLRYDYPNFLKAGENCHNKKLVKSGYLLDCVCVYVTSTVKKKKKKNYLEGLWWHNNYPFAINTDLILEN